MSMTAQQIITMAMQIAKAPSGYTSQAGQCFTLTLQDLLWKRDLRVNLTQETVAIPANSNGPFTGAANYLRTYDFFYSINGVTFFMRPVELSYFDAEFKQPQLANYPYEFAVDSSPQANQLPQLLYIYPMSNSPLSATHRYFMQQPDIATPESSSTVPWFADQDYLVTATAMRLMRITDDTRQESFKTQSEDMLRKYLIMEGDKELIPARVKLDQGLFKLNRSLRPTKVTG